MTDTRQALAERITSYLACGGLFNPELADHNAVRDLLIEFRAALAAQSVAGAVATSEQGWLHRIDMEKTAAWQQGYAQGLHRAAQAAPAPEHSAQGEPSNCLREDEC